MRTNPLARSLGPNTSSKCGFREGLCRDWTLSRAAFQHELAFEECVFVEFGEKFAQPEDSLETVDAECRVFRELGDLCWVDWCFAKFT
jgi:hypothetical protein